MSSAPVIGTEAAWAGGLLQISDSFFPTGGYAHSFGLEGLVQGGVVRDRETLRIFLRESVLPALAQAELPIVAQAWQALADPVDWADVAELSVLAHAQKTAVEARQATAKIGRQRAELAASLHGHALAQDYLRRLESEAMPACVLVVAAIEGRVLGAPLAAILSGVAYTSLAGLIAAAMKLLRLGQQGAQTLLVEVLRELPAVLAHAQRVAREDIGWFNPWLDIAAARHERADHRLFIS